MAKDSIIWTGKNLSEVRRFHKAVAHYPREEGDEGYRDASQHPDNLHLETEEGHTLIASPGDTITRDEEGRLTVRRSGKERPTATGRFGAGQVINVEAGRSRNR